MSKPASNSVSAGLLLFRHRGGQLEVFLAHPGGPFWKNRDAGAWTIPKGLANPGEPLLAAACREFQEETGLAPAGPFFELGNVRQKAGKTVHAWAFRGDAEAGSIRSNLVPMRTPAGWRNFPEIDRCEWFGIAAAKEKLNPAQAEFVDRLVGLLDAHGNHP